MPHSSNTVFSREMFYGRDIEKGTSLIVGGFAFRMPINHPEGIYERISDRGRLQCRGGEGPMQSGYDSLAEGQRNG